MAKLKSDPIGVADLTKYLETESDFDFELRVLHSLRDFGVDCEHGGHYEDPVTKKSREFDIRLRVKDGNFHLFAAIECKNLRPNFPLLISCVPRTPDEAWHFVAEKRSAWMKSHCITGDNSRYAPRGVVGKSTAQVGVTQTGDLAANDFEVYEKWGQCLASLYGMVGSISGLPEGSVSMAMPILVIPDERLWRVRYKKDGSRIGDPEQVNQCSVYAGGFEIPFDSGSRFRVSHVEIMTFEGLQRFCSQHLVDENTMRSLILGNHGLEP
jgi:hypothetical protein